MKEPKRALDGETTQYSVLPIYHLMSFLSKPTQIYVTLPFFHALSGISD